MEDKEKYHSIMMKTAELFAEQSYAYRRKVGAVLAKDGRILATGYNGTIDGTVNICETYSPYSGQVLKDDDKVVDCPVCEGKHRDCYACDDTSKLVIHNETNEFTVHAEQNIISYCAKNGIATKGTSLFITLSPCKNCAKLIAQSGIKYVYYKEAYKDLSGIEFLLDCGILSKKI